MKRIPVLASILLIMGTGCNKDFVHDTLTIEVKDYITGQPIEGAKVKRGWSSGFDFSCLCYQVNATDSLGSTNTDGQLKGLLTFDGIFIEKEDYFTASEHYYCTHEKNDYFLKFKLFKKSWAKVIANTSKSFWPEPYIEAGPVLINGSMKSLENNGDRMPANGSFNQRPTAGDMMNRILVLKRDAGSSRVDTLFKRDIFIPANTAIDIVVNY